MKPDSILFRAEDHVTDVQQDNLQKVFLISHFVDDGIPIRSPVLQGFQKAAERVIHDLLSQTKDEDVPFPQGYGELTEQIDHFRRASSATFAEMSLYLARCYASSSGDHLEHLRFSLTTYCFAMGSHLFFGHKEKEARPYFQIFIYHYFRLSEESHQRLNREFFAVLTYFFSSYGLNIDLYLDSDPSDEFYYRFVDVVREASDLISLGRCILEIAAANLGFLINIVVRLRNQKGGNQVLAKMKDGLKEPRIFFQDPLRSMRLLEKISPDSIGEVLSVQHWKTNNEKILLTTSLLRYSLLCEHVESIFSGSYAQSSVALKSDLAFAILTCPFEVGSVDRKPDIADLKAKLVVPILEMQSDKQVSEYLIATIQQVGKALDKLARSTEAKSKANLIRDVQNSILLSEKWAEDTQLQFSSETRGFFETVASFIQTEKSKLVHDTELDFRLVTEQVYHSPLGSQIVFEIRNIGEGLADFIRINVLPVEGVYDVDERCREIPYKPALGARQYAQIGCEIKPKVNPNSYLHLKAIVRFNTSATRDKTVELSAYSSKIYLYSKEHFDRIVPKPPYNISTPAAESFYGRESELNSMADYLHDSLDHDNSMIIYGTKRAGKTSVVKRFIRHTLVERQLDERYIPIYADIIAYKSRIINDSTYLSSLVAIIENGLPELYREQISIGNKFIKEFHSQPYDTFTLLLDEILNVIYPKKLLLVLDEFSKLEELFANQDPMKGFSDELSGFLSNTIQDRPQLTFVFTGTFSLLEMMRKRDDLYKICKPVLISYLKENAARQLASEPIVAGISNKTLMSFDDKVIEKIIRITNCHPFLIQYLCMTLTDRLNQNKTYSINSYDINEVIMDVVGSRIHDMPCTVFWNEFAGLPQQKMLSIIAENTTDKKPFVDMDTILAVFKRNKQLISQESIFHTCSVLEDADLILRSTIGNISAYSIKIPLYQMWLKLNKPTSILF